MRGAVSEPRPEGAVGAALISQLLKNVLKQFTVVNKARGCVLGQAIERADDSKTRRKGLLKRTGLQKGEGLWIVPCEAIHTFFMRFAIDVVFLDRNKRVVK